jgi:predicted DsbA family dithiol-disulfide isomerase
MDGAMILRLLQTDADREDIKARDAQFRQMGISGVPTFIVAGQHAVPGCQPTEMWLKVIDEIGESVRG